MGRDGLSDQGKVILEASQGQKSYNMGHTLAWGRSPGNLQRQDVF